MGVETVLGNAPSASEFAAPSQPLLATARLVEAKGIEPSSLGCEPSALPLSYTPTLAEAAGVEPARLSCSSGFGPGAVASRLALPRHCYLAVKDLASTTGAAHPGPSGHTCRVHRSREDMRVAAWGQKDSNPRASGLQPRQPARGVPPKREKPPEVAWGGSISRISEVGYIAAPRFWPWTWFSRDKRPAR
jgi:hypothetical protein